MAIDDDGKQQETDKHECIKNNLIQTIQITDSMIQQEEINHAIQLIEEAEYIYFSVSVQAVSRLPWANQDFFDSVNRQRQ